MQILRSILRPIRRHLSSSRSTMSPCICLSSPSRVLLSFMASAPPRWWPPALAPRSMAAPNSLVRRAFRLPLGLQNMTTISSGKVIITSQGNEHSSQGMKNIKMDNSEMTNIETKGTISEVIDENGRSDKHAFRTISVIDGKRDTWGQNVNLTGCEEDRRIATISVSEDKGYTVNNILPQSTHRDGSIYRGMDFWWKKEYCIADRNETRLEAMALSDPANSIIGDGTYMTHIPRGMLQFFSLKLAKTFVDGGLVKLYGYIATRDELDPLLNYIVNISRDDPIIVSQGSIINMAGPKRGIAHMDNTLIEYDMRIKVGEQEKDDLQLIDGASMIGPAGIYSRPFTKHIPGNYGAVDITLSRFYQAVEATVEVLILKVQSSFNLSLGCLTSGLNEKIRLFDGAITESRSLKRSVVAVKKETSIDLKFKVCELSSSFDQDCSFKAKTHGHDTQEIKTDFALISVKVIWSTLPRYFV